LNAELRVGLSRYYRRLGNGAAAYDWANDAVSLAARAGCHDVQGWAIIERGRASWQNKEFDRAEADFRETITYLKPYQANFDLARVFFLLAALLNEQGRNEADTVWIDAVTRITSGGYTFLLEQERELAFPLLSEFINSIDNRVASTSAVLLAKLERVPPPRLHITTLGRFSVRQERRTIPDQQWRRRKAGELFRLLLFSRGRSLLRDEVVESLWPEKTPSSKSSLFHQATSTLRRTLEPDLPEKFPSRYLEVEEGRISLYLPEGSFVDFEAFEKHVQREEWQDALSLYLGDFSPDDRYAPWAAPLRERMKQYAIRSALAQARNDLDAGKARNTLDLASQVLTLEPWQEEAVLLGMHASIKLEDRARALRFYLDLEKRLKEELGIEPQVEVQKIYQSLL
jgi:DNA-binding SARP family transcriptional activator